MTVSGLARWTPDFSPGWHRPREYTRIQPHSPRRVLATVVALSPRAPNFALRLLPPIASQDTIPALRRARRTQDRLEQVWLAFDLPVSLVAAPSRASTRELPASPSPSLHLTRAYDLQRTMSSRPTASEAAQALALLAAAFSNPAGSSPFAAIPSPLPSTSTSISKGMSLAKMMRSEVEEEEMPQPSMELLRALTALSQAATPSGHPSSPNPFGSSSAYASTSGGGPPSPGTVQRMATRLPPSTLYVPLPTRSGRAPVVPNPVSTDRDTMLFNDYVWFPSDDEEDLDFEPGERAGRERMWGDIVVGGVEGTYLTSPEGGGSDEDSEYSAYEVDEGPFALPPSAFTDSATADLFVASPPPPLVVKANAPPVKKARKKAGDPIDPNAEPPVKRGRGRPKKVKTSPSPPPSDVPKRGRGRPKKVVPPSPPAQFTPGPSDDDEGEEEEGEDAVPKKFGRSATLTVEEAKRRRRERNAIRQAEIRQMAKESTEKDKARLKELEEENEELRARVLELEEEKREREGSSEEESETDTDDNDEDYTKGALDRYEEEGPRRRKKRKTGPEGLSDEGRDELAKLLQWAAERGEGRS